MNQYLKKTFLLLPLATTLPIQAQEKNERPNLLFIMADQWKGDVLGCIGKEPVQTPYLDRLASEGVLFTNAVSCYPVSSPARGILMTGMYPMNNKVIGNCNSETAPYGVELPETARCWSDVLKDKQYRTGYIGKWHLDSPYKPYVDTYNNRGKVAWNEWCPPERRHGFDYWVAYGTYGNHLNPMYWEASAPRDSFFYANQWGPEYEVNRAIEFLSKQEESNSPFALVVSMNPPHTGYDLVPDKYKEIYKNLDIEALTKNRPDIQAKGTKMGDFFRENIRNYYACMTGVDENIGRLVNELKRLGLFENTIIVFTSDHGICLGTHNATGKDIYYEESMKVPLIISWPQRLKPRVDNHTMIAFGDMYSTLLSMMGFSKDIPQEVQTFDFAKTILSGKEDKKTIQPYYHVEPANPTSGYRGLRTSRYTFAVHATNGKIDRTILFDRNKDPYQMDDIAAEQPKLVRSLYKQLKKWLTKTNDPFAAYLSDEQ